VQSNSQSTNTTDISTTEAENSSPAMGDAVRVARWSRDPNGPVPSALLKGRLAIINNCLVMQNHQGAPPTLLIFPYRNGVWDDAKQTFTYEGKVIRIGEPIEVGGGRIQNFDYLKANGKYDVPDCGITDFWVAS
jgi:hypothetical protein